jgi:hypothetical protein
MVCSIGFSKALQQLKDKGMSDSEAIDLLKNADNFEDSVRAGIEGGDIGAEELNGLLTNSDSNVKYTTASILAETKTNTDLLAIKPQLIESGAWNAIAQAEGNEEWTKLPGKFDWNKANDDAYLMQYIKAGDKEALKIVEYAKAEAKKGNTDILVRLVGGMSKASVDDAKKIVNNDIELKTQYAEIFKDYRNIAPDDIVIDATYGTMKWKDHLGNTIEFDVVDGAGRIFDPTLNDGKGGYNNDFISEIKKKEGYDSATWSFNAAGYAKLLASGQLEGKTIDEQTTILTEEGITDLSNNDWWTCVGTLCGAKQQEAESGGSGSGGGLGKSSSSSDKVESTTEQLYVECNVQNATIWDKSNGKHLGTVNTTIVMTKGSYTIQVKADGYKTRETPVTIGSYPVSKTINLTKIGPSISTFIKGIGGIHTLTREKYLYLFCIYKMRVTSNYTWKTFAESVTTIESSAFPSLISKEDVLYVYYLVTGNLTSAQALVDAGNVTLLDAEGGETTVIEIDEIGSSGGI